MEDNYAQKVGRGERTLARLGRTLKDAMNLNPSDRQVILEDVHRELGELIQTYGGPVYPVLTDKVYDIDLDIEPEIPAYLEDNYAPKKDSKFS